MLTMFNSYNIIPLYLLNVPVLQRMSPLSSRFLISANVSRLPNTLDKIMISFLKNFSSIYLSITFIQALNINCIFFISYNIYISKYNQKILLRKVRNRSFLIKIDYFAYLQGLLKFKVILKIF